MKIPKTLKIGGRDYTVIYPHIFTDSTQVLDGLHDAGGQMIKISAINSFGEKRHPQATEQTFWHEVLHAIDIVFCGGSLGKTGNNELIIDQLAEGIAQVLRDNKLK